MNKKKYKWRSCALASLSQCPIYTTMLNLRTICPISLGRNYRSFVNNKVNVASPTNLVNFGSSSAAARANVELPTDAEVVVIGGGAIGTSTAYHLAKKGVDVTLLERHKSVLLM